MGWWVMVYVLMMPSWGWDWRGIVSHHLIADLGHELMSLELGSLELAGLVLIQKPNLNLIQKIH